MSTSAPAVLVAPRGAQLLGAVFGVLNRLRLRRWMRQEARRLRRVAEQEQRHVEELSGDDVGRLHARLAGLSR
jgi:hypothetical protein